MFYSFNYLIIVSNVRKLKNKTLIMFYSFIFLTFEWDSMYRYVFYTYIFLERKISITSKMFYFLDTPVDIHINGFIKKFIICQWINNAPLVKVDKGHLFSWLWCLLWSFLLLKSEENATIAQRKITYWNHHLFA